MSRIIRNFNNHYKRHLVAADVAYNSKSTLDIYATQQMSETPRPVIIFWYGGSWQGGDKSLYRFLADHLARQTGAVIIVPNYEKYPQVHYPRFIDEAWEVIDWVQKHAQQYNAGPKHYSVIGHSSGGHTACSVALGHRKPSHLPLPEKCVSLAGAHREVGRTLWPVFNTDHKDFTPFPNYFAAHLDTPIKTDFMLLHGLLDTVVSPTQFTKFHQTLRTAGLSVVAKWTLSTHPGIIIGLGSPFAHTRVYARQVVKFLKSKG